MGTAQSLNAPDYLRLLKGGTIYRMVRLNDRVAQAANNPHLPPSCKPDDWRKARIHRFTSSFGLSNGFNLRNAGTKYEKRTPIMVTFEGEQFRNEQWCDEVDGVRIDHTGWYADPDGGNTYRGFVFALSNGRFGAGYEMKDNGERVYYLSVFDNASDAARFADGEAQYYAEQECEYRQRWDEKQALLFQIEEVGRNVARMFKLRHTDGFDSAADYRELEEGIDELRRLKDRVANEYHDVEI